MSIQTLMTSGQAGTILGKSQRTVVRMAERGDLPYAQKLPGPIGAYLFDPDEVHRVARELRTRKTSKKAS